MPLIAIEDVCIHVMHLIRSAEANRGRRADSTLDSRFTRLYAAHGPEARRLAFVLTRDPNSAEELVQSAFVKVFARFRDRGPVDDFRAYLRRTIVNTWRSQHRRRLKTIPLSTEAASSIPDRSWMDAEQAVDHDHVWRALMNLASRQRAAILLRYFEHLSYEDIATALNTSEGAVRSLLRNALRRLRSALDEGGTE